MDQPVSHPGMYATDLLADLSISWIDDAAEKKSPFFLAINPVNPHGNYDWKNGKWTAPIPADRHKDDFPGAVVPRDTKNYNPDSVGAILCQNQMFRIARLHFKIAERCQLGSRTG